MNKTLFIFLFISITTFLQAIESQNSGTEINLIESSSNGYYISLMGINPFSPVFANTFGIKDTSLVDIYLSDINGKRVKSLYKGTLGNGVYKISWNGIGESGKRLAEGIYFFEMEAKYPYQKKNEPASEMYLKARPHF